jgi:hypothetical protein
MEFHLSKVNDVETITLIGYGYKRGNDIKRWGNPDFPGIYLEKLGTGDWYLSNDGTCYNSIYYMIGDNPNLFRYTA